MDKIDNEGVDVKHINAIKEKIVTSPLTPYYGMCVNSKMHSKTKRQIQKIIRRIKSAITSPVHVGSLHSYYRFSDAGYDKLKPLYVNNKNCLRNFVQHFGEEKTLAFADNVSDTNWDQLLSSYPK